MKISKGFCIVLFCAMTMIAATDATQAAEPVTKAAHGKKHGKMCKGFNPKDHVVIERDKNGNCVYYETKIGTPVKFIYDVHGEMAARDYSNMQ